jgi:hypothetical protein
MRSGSDRQRGSVAIMTGLMIAVLVGFLGLAVDAGRLFVIKSELQTAMDACALAAASQLRPGLDDPNALARAMAYGRTPPNRANFQGQPVEPERIQFSFAERLEGPYGDGGGIESLAQYVRCAYPLENVPLYFMRVVTAFSDTTVAASAVGTLTQSQSGCGFPVAVCRNTIELQPGLWIGGPVGTTPANNRNEDDDAVRGCDGQGNYCWIDFGGDGSGGARGLDELISGNGTCNLDVLQVRTQTGHITSLNAAWNTRFGIYKRNELDARLVSSPPDRTGYGYTLDNWPSGEGAYEDYKERRARNDPYDDPKAFRGNQHVSTAAELAEHGRDRRLVVAPIMDCSTFGGGSQQVNIEGWACLLMLAPITHQQEEPRAQFEYIGPATDPGSPCATMGLPGTDGPLVPVLAQ